MKPTTTATHQTVSSLRQMKPRTRAVAYRTLQQRLFGAGRCTPLADLLDQDEVVQIENYLNLQLLVAARVTRLRERAHQPQEVAA